MYGNNKPVSWKYCEISSQVRSSEGKAYAFIACSLTDAMLFLTFRWPKGDECLEACITPIFVCSLWFSFSFSLLLDW